MSFDTESNGTSLVGPTGQKDRIIVLVASPGDTKVLVFHDSRDNSTSIKELLENSDIFKTQSSIQVDVSVLKKAARIDVQVTVDSGTLFQLSHHSDIFGLKEQMAVMWPLNPEAHVPYNQMF